MIQRGDVSTRVLIMMHKGYDRETYAGVASEVASFETVGGSSDGGV